MDVREICLYNYCNSVAIFVEIVIAKVTDGFCVYKYCIYTCGTLLYRADCSHSCLGNAFTITVTAFAIFVKDFRCKLTVTFCLYKYRISTCGICKRPFAARRGSKMRVQQLLSYLSCDSCKGHSAVVCTGYCRLQSLYLYNQQCVPPA